MDPERKWLYELSPSDLDKLLERWRRAYTFYVQRGWAYSYGSIARACGHAAAVRQERQRSGVDIPAAPE